MLTGVLLSQAMLGPSRRLFLQEILAHTTRRATAGSLALVRCLDREWVCRIGRRVKK